ncbi:hypothetical protein BGZ97_006074 [Linnemannia gamsii]|uniref:YCII-related domain-containing protein n=1 Tax=Linnemannia gamsii TaxID=64522 RepID=A0A9P6US80_9FUNG|nr:hypothetical protein BGZ97_006074 [Linnemannia gamsii]
MSKAITSSRLATLPARISQHRTLTVSATANAAKQQFILIARDFKDPEAITRRLDTRTKHLAEARELKKSGQIHYAGALFSDHSDSGKMVGSVIVFQAENAEEVRKIVERNMPENE